MFWWKYVVLSALLALAACQSARDFPEGFLFGAGTSSYQVEGGWNASDKTPNIWDHYTHTHPEDIEDGTNGDVACDSYHLWERDIEMAVELGLDFYRFSISWARLLPSGFSNHISEDGKNYYNNLINGLLEKGIQPLITIYHRELPQSLQDLGGWANPLIVDWFADYARVVFSLYSDRVKTWLTINEPISICDLGYAPLHFAPDINDTKIGVLLCSKHVVLAHAKAYRIYDEEFRAKDKGIVSFANHIFWFDGLTPEDAELAELALLHMTDRFAHPIYTKEGGWPPAIEKLIAENSAAEGYPFSRLPAFTPEEIELAKGTYDFMGMNQYTSRAVRRALPGEEVGEFPMTGSKELNIVIGYHPDSKPTGYSILPSHPASLRKSLVWLKQQYGDIPIFVTENGYGSDSEDLENTEVVNFYRDYLEQLLLAIKEDGVNVMGYSAWSMMDNFEWPSGYLPKFGLYHVNFSDPLRTRTPRNSALYYARVVKARSLDVSEEFEPRPKL